MMTNCLYTCVALKIIRVSKAIENKDMNKLCPDTFWNTELTWNNARPKFTTCFINSLDFFLLAIFLLVGLPWLLFLMKVHSTKAKLSKSWNFIAKVCFNLILITAHSLKAAMKGSAISHWILPLALYLLILILTFYERRKRIKSSLISSIFWPCVFIASLPTFINNVDDESISILSLDCGCLVVTFCLIVINFFADLSGLEDDQQSPKHLASFASSLIFGWFEPIVVKGYKHGLTQKDLPRAPNYLDVGANVETFLKQWNLHVQGVDFSSDKPRPTLKLWKPLIKSFGWRFLIGNCIGLLNYTELYLSPLILRLLINHIDNAKEETWKGYLYALALFAASVLNTILFSHYVICLNETGIQIRSSLISAICRKALKISNSARQSYTTGEITNLVSVDCQRIADALGYIGVLWGAPVQVLISLWFIYGELGTAALVGSLGMIVLVPLNLVIGKVVKKLEKQQLTAKDARIKAMNEILNGIKVLKLYAWELPFIKRITDIRFKEIQFLKVNAWIYGVINFTFCMTPFLVTIGSFSCYVLIDPVNHILTPEKVFVCISLFNLLRIPLTLFPLTFKSSIDMMVSFNRITAFLNANELQSQESEISQEAMIQVQDGCFAWTKSAHAELQDLTFQVESGSLTAIVGTVGSGKSSILQAILGEMKRTGGQVLVKGQVAYASQEAWIQNLTLKDNVLFDNAFDQRQYKQVLKACALEADIELLANGDMTEIGENGINLSGGQKQRVALARAVYADADIYLLDDPLSAVDAHVGKHIFDQVLSQDNGILKNKTRLWVTNQLSFLPKVDHVIFLQKGKICDQGTFEQLFTANATFRDFSQQVSNLESSESSDPGKTEKDLKEDSRVEKPQDSGKLIDEEKSLTGHVPLHVFKDFFNKMGPWFFAAFLLSNVIEQALHAGGILWLSDWSEDEDANENVNFRLGIYAGISVVETIVLFTRDVLFYTRCAMAAKLIHESLLFSVMRSPMSFFDTTPLGRIINRFSADIDVLDMMIPTQLADFIWCFTEVLATFTVISFATPLFLTAVLPVGAVFFLIQRVYIVTSRQLKRLFSVSKSPIFSHFSETVSGACIIRAFGQEDRFIKEMERRVGDNIRSGYLNLVSNRWLSMRIENMANVMIFLTALFCIIQRNSIKPGLAALSMTYALNIIGSVVWFVRMACELETNCVALERIFEYTSLKSEAEWSDSSQEKTAQNWPDKGEIKFIQYHTKYREGLDPVLKGVDLQAEPEEKIGICGRTGAGKSSLTLSLFRIIEPIHGQILIDNFDITKLGLHQLRSNLAIIPQDPVLFTGTLRFNLDPVGQYKDQDIWRALELAHLKAHLNNGLDTAVSEGGSNFSVGQKQLICLARALLKKSKILVLDEATAAVDPETDELIQSTIKTQFKHCTVLTIAHRLNTILDSDKIIVLANGQVAETGSPSQLLANPDSKFKGMALSAGMK